MKKALIPLLRCLSCKTSDWEVAVETENGEEIREGSLECRSCQRTYLIREGILNALEGNLPEEIVREKRHAESFGYLVAEDGEKFAINRETIERFRGLFLSLPAGDGSHYFRPGGSFDNQAGNARRFFQTLELLNLTGKERVLEVGSSFGWGARRFAQRGCEVTALDVTNYLVASDLYFETDHIYFERVMSDMSTLPFCDGCFDIIFSHSVIHHCRDLKSIFSEFRRVLKPGGRVVALHECSFGVFENKSGKALQEAIQEGFNENAYTIPQWERGARSGGFKKIKLHFFSPVADYVDRKKLRRVPRTSKIAAAEWICAHPRLDKWINRLSVWPRILFRPKAWMLIATK